MLRLTKFVSTMGRVACTHCWPTCSSYLTIFECCIPVQILVQKSFKNFKSSTWTTLPKPDQEQTATLLRHSQRYFNIRSAIKPIELAGFQHSGSRSETVFLSSVLSAKELQVSQHPLFSQFQTASSISDRLQSSKIQIFLKSPKWFEIEAEEFLSKIDALASKLFCSSFSIATEQHHHPRGFWQELTEYWKTTAITG